jgi:hypothetical protein
MNSISSNTNLSFNLLKNIFCSYVKELNLNPRFPEFPI